MKLSEHIIYGSRRIEFELTYTDRKTLGITVHPDRTVEVKAPRDASQEKVFEKVRKRASWIMEQKRFFMTFEPRRKEYLYKSGETHFYLGRQYLLKIRTPEEAQIDSLLPDEKGSVYPEEVLYRRNHLLVITEDKSPARIRYLLEKWYRQRAGIKFPEYAEPLIDRFRNYNVSPKNLLLRKMATRWGSCSGKGNITLNPELIKAPKACIEYVILHELCHLVHRNHTSGFFALLTREMPDWEKWKEKLEIFMA